MLSFKTITVNVFFQIIARLSSSISGFLIAIIIARFLGLNGYGEYAKVTAYIGLFYLFVDFGCNAVFLRKNKSNFGELVAFRLILSFVIWGISIAISFLLPSSKGIGGGFSFNDHIGIYIFSLTLITEGIVYSISAKFQENLSYIKLAFSAGAGSIVTLAGVVIVVLGHFPIYGIFISFLLGSFAKAILSLFLSGIPVSNFKTKPQEIKIMLKEASFVGAMLIANMIYFRIDMLILSLLRSSVDVAQYDFAYKFFDFLIALPLYISNTLYPSLIKKTQNNLLKKNDVLTLSGIFGGIGVVICLVVFFLAPAINLVRPEFSGSVVSLRIFSVFLPVFFITNILQWILIARGEQKFLFLVYAVGAIINIILNLIYIPMFSFIGASIITGISETLVLTALIIKICHPIKKA